MYSKNEYNELNEFENVPHILTVMIVIIFCLLFVIFLTLFDYYKKPSIYELELLNEYKSTCESKNNSCNSKNDKEDCEENKDKKENEKNKRMLLIYQDVFYLIFYVIALYLLSLTFIPESIIGFIAIFMIVCIVKVKRQQV